MYIGFSNYEAATSPAKQAGTD